MSPKKSRKNRQPNVPPQTTPEALNTPAKAGGGGNVVKMNTRNAAPTESITADYTYVFSDLRRILMLAGLLIAGLIVLSFFIK